MYELIGPVQNVEVYLIDYFMKDNRIEPGTRRPVKLATFNKDGNLIESTIYDHMGAISTRYEHTYDKNGRSTGYKEYPASYDKSLTTARPHVYSLDVNGRKKEYVVYEPDGTMASRFVYKYDRKGHLIEQEWYPHTGRLGGRSRYTYDAAGNKTEEASFDSDGRLGWKALFKYDSHGNQIETHRYERETLRYKIVSIYDAKRRLIEKETFEFNALPNVHISHAPRPGKVVYSYDDEKRTKLVTEYKPNGELKSKIVFAYDERGDEIGRTAFRGDGTIEDHVISFYDNISEPGSPFRGNLRGRWLTNIEYDSQGNWIKKTNLIQPMNGGKPQAYRAEVRVITYY